MQKILITGGNGFLGYYLTRLLLEKGYAVIGTGRGELRHQFTGPYRYFPLDFTMEENVGHVFKAVKPDVVVHCGAISKPDFCEANRENAFRTNVTGTINLLLQSEITGAHFIFLSTDFVFSGNKPGMDITAGTGFYKEDDKRAPVNFYGETKMLAEDEVLKAKLPTTIVRTAFVYGKPVSGRDNLVASVAQSLAKGERVKIFADQVRTPTYVKDLAAGIGQIIIHKATGVYHIAGDEVLSLCEMAIATAKFLKLDEALIGKVYAGDLDQPAQRPAKTCLDISKAKTQLKYKPQGFQNALADMFGGGSLQ